MAFTTINLTEPVLAEELAVYGAKAGQHDAFVTGVAVFGVNKSGATIAKGDAFVNAHGELNNASGIKVKTLADCPAGAGIYGVAMGILPDGSEAIAYTVQ
jgi:hypothetical protein